MHKQIIAFQHLWGWTPATRKIYLFHLAENGSKLHVTLLNLKTERGLELEIKDIVEEIGIMIHIHKTQRDVFKQFQSHVEHILDPSGTNAEDYYKDGQKGKAVSQTAASRRPSLAGTPSRSASPALEPSFLEGRQDLDGRPDFLDSRTYFEFTDKQNNKESQALAYDCFKVNSHEMRKTIDDRIKQLEDLAKNAESTAASVSTKSSFSEENLANKTQSSVQGLV